MNLYLLKRTDELDYDQFDAAVVVAANEDDARKIHPSGNAIEDGDWGTWTSEFTVTYLGIADPSITDRVVCASFNAG